MDRIATLRNVEEALTAFEDGKIDLDTLERRVGTALRTYATEFDDDRAAYRVREPTSIEGTVVVASSTEEATERVAELHGTGSELITLEIDID